MNERDMMYGGYYQNMPGNMSYGNFSYQGLPGSLLNNGMIAYPNNINDMNNNPLTELTMRVRNLENRVKNLEQKIGNTSSYQDDNSMYMI